MTKEELDKYFIVPKMMKRDKDFYKRVKDKNYLLADTDALHDQESRPQPIRHSYFRETI